MNPLEAHRQYLTEIFLRPVLEDPQGEILRIRRRVHTEYFLRRFTSQCADALSDLREKWRGRAGNPLPVDLEWCGRWLERFGMPDTDDSRSLITSTLISWREWFQAGLEPPAEWWPQCHLALPQPGAAEEPPIMPLRVDQQGWPPGPFTVVVVPGWESRESEADFRKRAERAYRQQLSSYLGAAKLFRKAFHDEELLLAEPSSKTKLQLDLLAEYQAAPDLSMLALGRRVALNARQVRYALHQAAKLIGLPIDRLIHAPSSPSKAG